MSYLLEKLSKHATCKGDGSQEWPNYGACEELVEHVLLDCVPDDSNLGEPDRVLCAPVIPQHQFTN